jgi:hypothetical protein
MLNFNVYILTRSPSLLAPKKPLVDEEMAAKKRDPDETKRWQVSEFFVIVYR